MSAVELALIAVVFLGLFGLTARGSKSVLAPAPLWNLMWFLSFITSAAFGQGFIFDAGALYLLAVVAAGFNLGALLAGAASSSQPVEMSRFGSIPLKLIVLFLVGSVVGLVSVSRDLGTSLLSVGSLESLLSAGHLNAVAIFRGEVAFSGVSKVGFAMMQVGFALTGAQWALGRSRGLMVTAAAFLGVAFVWSTVTTQRSYLLVPVVWWVGGYIASACWSGRRVVAPRVIVRVLAVVCALVLLVVWMRSVRLSGTSATLDTAAFSASLPWLAGYLPAFSVWHLSGGGSGPVPGLFGGVTGLLGTRSTEQSGGTMFIGAGAVSNAPTMMRDVFAVGGPLTAFVIIVVLGIVAHAAYRRAVAGRPGAAAFYAGVVAMILWAPNAWFYSYGGRTLAWVILLSLGWNAGARLRKRERVRRCGVRSERQPAHSRRSMMRSWSQPMTHAHRNVSGSK